MLTQELLDRLRIGDRPVAKSEATDRWIQRRNAVYLEAAIALGVTWRYRNGWTYDHNELIDRLDQKYPGWRGYEVQTNYNVQVVA